MQVLDKGKSFISGIKNLLSAPPHRSGNHANGNLHRRQWALARRQDFVEAVRRAVDAFKRRIPHSVVVGDRRDPVAIILAELQLQRLLVLLGGQNGIFIPERVLSTA